MTKRSPAPASQFVDVLGSKMHYIEEGKGDPILFIHGIPTSSYLWRNVIPHLSILGRCIAPDLIGFGKSAKPNIAYTVFDHIHYIEKFIETLKLSNLTIIMHGWGSVIGFDYAMRHQKNCKGLVFYEAFLRTLNEEDETSLPFTEQTRELQMTESEAGSLSTGVSFVDQMLAQDIMQALPDADMEEYRAPFKEKGSAKPIVQYLKELPSGNDSKVKKLIADYTAKLMQSPLPKLMLYSIPGFITPMNTVMWAKNHLPNLEIIDIGEELHLAQESNPTLIGESISVWLQGVEQLRV